MFGANVNQDLIESQVFSFRGSKFPVHNHLYNLFAFLQMSGMVSKTRSVNGVPTSLQDLGYIDVGLDDAWWVS